MVASKVLLIDWDETIFEFRETGDLLITKKNAPSGVLVKGQLLTPINEIGLRKKVLYSLEGQPFSTTPLKGCMVDE